MLGLIHIEIYSFQLLRFYILILYFILVRHKLQYGSSVRNCMTSAEDKKMESFQWQFVAHCQYCSVNYRHVTYYDYLQFQELHNLRYRIIHFVSLFLFLLVQI